MTETNTLQLPFSAPGLGAHARVNQALLILDAVAGRILARQNDAPTDPVDWDAYIVKVPTSGDPWEGLDDHLVIWFSGQWHAIEPRDGMRVWVENAGLYLYQQAWIPGAAGAAVFAGRGPASDQSSTTTTWAGIDFTTDVLEHADAFVHPVSANDARVEVVTGGIYRVTLNADVENTGGAIGNASIAIGVNSETTPVDATIRRVTLGITYRACLTSVHHVLLAAGDDVYPIMRREAGGGTMTIRAGRMAIEIARVGPA